MNLLLPPLLGDREGSLARRIRERDWAATPLGPPEGWALPLRTLLGVMLGSNQPMFVAWGPELTLLYNDAYAEILAGKHPEALGRPFLDAWHEIRGDLVPIVEQAMRGEPVQMDDITLFMERRGFREETHFAFSYTPVRGEAGEIEGFFCACQETTGRVLAERRQAYRLNLEERLRAAATPVEALGAACEALGRVLGAALCALGEVERAEDGQVLNEIRAEWRAGNTASTLGRHRLADYGPERVRDLLSGDPVRVEDVLTDPRTAGTGAEAAYAALGARASLDVPLVRDGEVRALLAVGMPDAHRWTEEEVALAQETAERSWAAAERARAERALAESDARAREEAERVRLALDAGAIIGTWFWDLRRDRFTVDEAFARSFGLDPALGRQGLSLAQVVATVHPDDIAGLKEAIAEVIGRGGRYAHQYRVRRCDGRYYWIEANGRVDLGPDGAAVSFPGVLLDVEARRAAEAERDRARRLLESFVEAVPGVVYAKDREGRMLVANRGTTELIGKPPEEYLGRTDAEFLDDPEQGRAIMENDRRIMDAGVAEQVEEAVSLADGSPAWWFSTKAPLRDEAGRVVGLVGSSVDITARKAAEAALTESEERFRSMAAALPGLLHVTSVEGENLYVNEGFKAYTGLSDEELAGKGWGLVLHPDDTPAAVAAWEAATATEAPYMSEYRVRRHDGEWRWHATRALPVRGEDGTVLHWVGVAVDVHERKAAEEELRARTAEIESLLTSAPLGVAFFDREHRWVRINEELAAVNGFPVAEHIGRRMAELLPVNAGFVGPVLDRIFKTGEAVRNVELTGEVPHAPGAPRTWLVNYYPVVSADGEITAVGTWVVDITERKAAEERLRALTDALPAFVWFAQPDGAIQSLNERWYDYTGQTPEEALPFGWVAAAHPEDQDRVHRVWQEALAARTTYEVEMRYRRRDEIYRWHVARAVPLRDARGEVTGWVGTSSDIDDRVQAEVALRALNETLESRIEQAIAERERAEAALRQSQKMEAVGQLTGGIAHDFNNMLAAVVGSLDLLGRRIGDGDARARRYVDGAMEGARRAANLTQRLLAFSRQQPLRPEPLDLNRLVAGMSDLLQRSLGAGVRLETVLAGGLWKAHADPNQLENVILNLAVNARDAMPGGGRLTIETGNAYLDSHYASEHMGVLAGQYVQISVSDTGTGMTPEVIARAFDPFFTTKPVGQGTGLGLSQVYGFVRQSGGHVSIYSEPGEGTTVKVYLPRMLAAQAETAEEEPPRELPRGEAQELVLVVEDEPVVRRFTVDALEELGYRVLEADGAEAALRLLDAHPDVALLFTDVVMPETNGRKLADEALRRRPGLRVLFTTGYTRNAVVHNGVLDPGVHLIGKPFTVDELAAKLREVLEEPARG